MGVWADLPANYRDKLSSHGYTEALCLDVTDQGGGFYAVRFVPYVLAFDGQTVSIGQSGTGAWLISPSANQIDVNAAMTTDLGTSFDQLTADTLAAVATKWGCSQTEANRRIYCGIVAYLIGTRE